MSQPRHMLLATFASALLVGLVAPSTGCGGNIRAKIALHMAKNRRPDVAPNRAVTWSRGPSQDRTDKPNVVFILLDDVGYNDLSVFGAGIVPTPNIDALAAEGALFTQAYAGNATCAPSRAMLLTGRYPTRTGFEFTPTPPGMPEIVSDLMADKEGAPPKGKFDAELAETLPPFDQQGLGGEEVTLAEMLRTRGYHTVHIGKWHLGRSATMRPTAQGFDESLLLASGLYLPEDDPNVVNAKLEFDPIDQFFWASMSYAVSLDGGDNWFAPKGYLTDYFTEEALKVIEANANRPFFLYLAHWGVHSPLQATRADYDALPQLSPHRMRVHGAMIRALDRSVGKIVEKLNEAGLAKDTIVVFSSDNGGAGYIGIPETNKPFRGFKSTFFEGGIRVPTFVRWPGRIAPKTTIDTPISHIDWTPTLASATGAALPRNRAIDGEDLLPLLLSREDALTRPDEALFWSSGRYKVVRAGDWKLQVNGRQGKEWLFNLAKDPTEQKNLAASKPGKLAELRALLDAHWKDAVAPSYPSTTLMPVAIDKTLAEPFVEGDEYIHWPN